VARVSFAFNSLSLNARLTIRRDPAGEGIRGLFMDLSKSPLLAGLGQRLQFLAARTSVIAENIANSDTPGYVARDLDPSGFQARVGAALRVSDPRHLQSNGAAGAAVKTHLAPDGEASLSGNQVSIETQMMKLSATRMDYGLASSIYRKSVDLVRLAVRGGR
jgi:flagellar basal-body rod protein FlgB